MLRQQPFAHTVFVGQDVGSMPPGPQAGKPSGQEVPVPPSSQVSFEMQSPGPHPSTGQLPPVQKSTQASPESPPTLF